MTIDILLSEDKKDHILRLKDLLNNLYVSASIYILNDQWHLDQQKKMDKLLGNGDLCLICCDKEALSSSWVLYALGYFEGKGRDVVFFLPDVNTDEIIWLQNKTILTQFIDLREILFSLIEVWNTEMTHVVAERTLRNMGIEKALYNFTHIIEDGDRLLAGIFLEAGFPVNCVNEKGVAVLSLAVRYSRVTLVKLLCDAGANYNYICKDRNTTAIMDASSSGNNELIDFFLEYDDIDLSIVNKNGQTALLMAVGNKHLETAKKLIDIGADINHLDNMGMSARKYAKLYEDDVLLAYMDESEKKK